MGTKGIWGLAWRKSSGCCVKDRRDDARRRPPSIPTLCRCGSVPPPRCFGAWRWLSAFAHRRGRTSDNANAVCLGGTAAANPSRFRLTFPPLGGYLRRVSLACRRIAVCRRAAGLLLASSATKKEAASECGNCARSVRLWYACGKLIQGGKHGLREDAYNEPPKILSPTTETGQPRSRQSARPHKAPTRAAYLDHGKRRSG